MNLLGWWSASSSIERYSNTCVSIKKPSIRLAIEINKRVRGKDEWFEEPDDLERVSRALSSVDREENPVVAAGILAYRVTRAQGFAEGNKRTALLLARWVLDNNGIDGNQYSRVTTLLWQTC